MTDDPSESRERIAEEIREAEDRMAAIIEDPSLSRADKIRLLDEITGEGDMTLAVMLGEATGCEDL